MTAAPSPPPERRDNAAPDGQPPGLTRLVLTAFRNYRALSLTLDAPMIVLTGPNGAGKTNILEAVSLLTPGRGLRGASLNELGHREAAQPWAVAGSLSIGRQSVDMGTGLDPEGTERRVARINGAPARGLNRLGEHLAAVWLTPAMDGLFTGGAGDRRRFLDRVTASFDADHTGRVSAYDQALRQRRKLARDGNLDERWHAALEDTMARYGVAITAARADMVQRLTDSLAEAVGPFPAARIRMEGWIDETLANGPALAAEDALKARLADTRMAGDVPGILEAAGPHQSDLVTEMIGAQGPMPAGSCSTGEQKALLTSLILAHARLLAQNPDRAIVILLDEIGAHLDPDRRAALFELLADLPAQIWMTGTEPSLFEDTRAPAQFLSIDQGRVLPQVTRMQ